MTKKIAYPERIKVGPYRFNLCCHDWQWVSENGKLGDMNPVEMCINVGTEGAVSQVVVLDTLLHEVLHAIRYAWSPNMSDELEEHLVSSLATGLTSVMIDNPKLVDSLKKLAVAGGKE